MDRSDSASRSNRKGASRRDPGEYAVVIGIVDHRFVWIADGDKRKFDQPKKKNLIHLQLQETISSEVAIKLRGNRSCYQWEIAFCNCTNSLNLMQDEAQEKGE